MATNRTDGCREMAGESSLFHLLPSISQSFEVSNKTGTLIRIKESFQQTRLVFCRHGPFRWVVNVRKVNVTLHVYVVKFSFKGLLKSSLQGCSMLFPVSTIPRTLVTATENCFGNQNFAVDFATTQMHLFMQSNLGS